MKIFNIKPIKVTEYIFNEEHLAKSLTSISSESGFSITGEVIESVNTLIIEFEILYTAGDHEESYIVSSDEESQFTIHTTSEMFSGEIFLSYKSSCQFNFESEGFDADVISITEFLAEYCKHTTTFFNQYGFKPIRYKELEMGMYDRIKEDALIGIENLRGRGNNMYEF